MQQAGRLLERLDGVGAKLGRHTRANARDSAGVSHVGLQWLRLWLVVRARGGNLGNQMADWLLKRFWPVGAEVSPDPYDELDEDHNSEGRGNDVGEVVTGCGVIPA